MSIGSDISYLAIPLGYLLGSFPSAYVIGRLTGHIDMRTEGDGRISAAAVYRKIGIIPYLLVVASDIGKGVLSILLANLISNSLPIMLVTGFVTMVGHCWSVFLKFRGGLGATVICGVLISVPPITIPLIIAMLIGGIVALITHKSGLATGIILVLASIILLIQNILYKQPPLFVAPFPIILALLMVFKRLQVNRSNKVTS